MLTSMDLKGLTYLFMGGDGVREKLSTEAEKGVKSSGYIEAMWWD